jgi:hypothetical protein
MASRGFFHAGGGGGLGVRSLAVQACAHPTASAQSRTRGIDRASREGPSRT